MLAAHATDADGRPGVFAGLDSLVYGQQVILHVLGQAYTYEVRTVDDWVRPNDIRLITRHEQFPWLTLVTCHGYNPENGTYNFCTVVRAVQVRVSP